MKKLLILGASHSQLPIIKKAKELGHYVITCDYIEENPGHKIADEYYFISNTDKEAVLALAKLLSIDGLVCFASDAAVSTVAFVAEKLGFPFHPYKSVEILSNKDLFREFLKDNNFKVPRAKGYRTVEEAKADFHVYKMPVMIKPVDSSGSRGVSKIDSIELLQDKVELALSFSSVKRFIIEEYIENGSYQVGGDGFSVNGRLVFRSFTNGHFPALNINPFVPIGGSWPSIMPKSLQNKIHDEIQRVLEVLNMKTGAYNFDIRIDRLENIFILELSPRNGGNIIPLVTHYATGVDLIEYSVKSALGEDCSDMVMADPKGYWSSYIINSQQSGIFNGIEIDEDLRVNNIVEYDLHVNLGDAISAFTGSNEKLGTMVLKYSSINEMLNKMENMEKWVRVIINEPINSENCGDVQGSDLSNIFS